LRVELVSSDRFRVTGKDEHVHRVGAEVGSAAGDSGADRGEDSGDESDCDWFAAVDKEKKKAAKPRARARRSSAAPASGPPAAETDVVIEALEEMVEAFEADLLEDGECDEPSADESDEDDDAAQSEMPEAAIPEGPVDGDPPGPDHPSPVGEVDIAQRRRECLDSYKECDDVHTLLDELGAELLPNNNVRLRDGIHLGHIRVTFQGRTLYAKCSRHSSCSTMVNIYGEFDRAQSWVVKWLLAGAECSAAEHGSLKGHLKRLVADARKT